MLEIMKAYRRNTTVIAFDEPTASLMDSEINTLFGLVEELKQQGKIILYISHRMSEIFRITDEIVVLKDGRFVLQIPTREITEQELIRSMVGRDIGNTYSGLKRAGHRGDAILELRNVTTQKLRDVSLTLHKGEILGIAGLAGSGRTEIASAVFGVDAVTNGEILLDGKRIHFRNPKQAISAGIALCPEDRKDQGLVLIRSITDNVCMPVLRKLQSGVFLNREKQRSLADEAVEKYAIKTPTTDKAVIELSGGNQQKVILGRWTSNAANTRILILDEPTKGIDVGTKAEIYQMICDFANKGMAVIFISSELTEVIHLADRIIVMRDGMMSGEVTRENASEESILTLAMKE
jgi:ABC-type sugar transport system ATPase subunit